MSASKYDVRLTVEEAQNTIDRQLELYRQIQDRAHRLLRTFITSSALLVAALSFLEQVTQFSISGMFQFDQPTNAELVAKNVGQPIELVGSILAYHVIVGTLAVVAGFLLFIRALWLLLRTIRSPSFEPGLSGYKEYSFTISKNYRASEYSNWIRENNKEIEDIRSNFDKSISSAATAPVIIIAGWAAIILGYNGAVTQIVLVDCVALFVLPFLFVSKLSRIFLGEKEIEENALETIEAVDKWTVKGIRAAGAVFLFLTIVLPLSYFVLNWSEIQFILTVASTIIFSGGMLDFWYNNRYHILAPSVVIAAVCYLYLIYELT